MRAFRRVLGWLGVPGDARSYGGNLGYVEDHRTVYRFDSDVQNHKQVRPGSMMLIRDQNQLLGAARVATVTSTPGTKQYRRCPECGTTSHIERVTKAPRYKCKKGHVFEALRLEDAACTNYEAHFGVSFHPAKADISIAALRKACPRYADQVSIQRLQLNLLGPALHAAIPDLHLLLDPSIELEALSGSVEVEEPFVPSTDDRRQAIVKQLKLRRGQGRFRQALIRRYEGKCLVSGCSFIFIVEAAHISPFRGDEDHHPENGLLLRPDLHTLYDLDLLGVHPETLEVHLHPELTDPSYTPFSGRKLCCGEMRPSYAALASRWEAFSKRAERPLRGSQLA